MSKSKFLLLLLKSVLNVVSVTSLLPQVSQEGLLRPYRSYADVTLFHYFVPNEVSRATFEFAAFMDSGSCPVRNVYIFLQHGSYPVMSPDNATFPENLFTGRTSMFNVVLRSSYQPHDATVFPVYNPLPGSWFAAAYLPDWDQHVQQEGLAHKCEYSLGSVALWSQVANVETIPIKTTTRLSSLEHFTYFKFYIPAGTWEFKLRISGCHIHSTHLRFPEGSSSKGYKSNITSQSESHPGVPCIRNVFLRPRALPRFKTDGTLSVITDLHNSEFSHVEKLPYTDSYYYLLIVAETETKVSYNVSISIKDCPIQILGRSFIQQFAGVHSIASLKDQAVRINMSTTVGTKAVSSETAAAAEEESENLSNFTCSCVPVFRLTRIKHAQDFSDTFLLEGREWFTTWLAVTDSMPIGTALEILPYVDIGGTLSIGIHLDALLINATIQTIHVFACVRKSRPPEPLCFSSLMPGNMSSHCPSGLGLHVSSENVSVIDDNILIPFPEPDAWYISFTTVCMLGENVVPCILEESLLSLDIRTQPCVLTKPSSPGSAILPCGSYGICQEVHKGQFFYTACRCIGGYRGWACTDDSQATPEILLLTATLLLTLSNLFFIPAIILALRRKMFTQCLIYATTMISSAFYHACDQDIYGYCLTRYSVLQFCDFFCSILAFWVTLIALAKSPPKYDSSLYMLGAVVIAIGVEYNRTGLMVFVFPFVLGISIPISVWSYRSIRSRSLILPNLSTVLLFLPGVFLGGGGLILFAFVETEDNYRYTHSAWHVIIALSLVYLLPKHQKSNHAEAYEPENEGNTAAAELAAVNGDSQQQSASPVFFITSDLDHLVQEQPR